MTGYEWKLKQTGGYEWKWETWKETEKGNETEWSEMKGRKKTEALWNEK